MHRLRGKPIILAILIILFLIIAASTPGKGGKPIDAGTEHSANTAEASPISTRSTGDRDEHLPAISVHISASSMQTAGTKQDTDDKDENPRLSERLVHYDIKVRLDEEHGILSGRQTLVWRHPGTKPVNEVYLHTYPNAFQSDLTTFMQESGGKLRNDNMPKDGYGRMEIERIVFHGTYAGEPGQWSSGPFDRPLENRYVQPDDGNPYDRTLLNASLPQPVYPGEAALFTIDFTVQLPFAFARMGKIDDFVMAGQWYPKMSVYEPAGTRGRTEEGWNAHQYHGNSEFYADFGSYQVELNLPDDYVVAATGIRTASQSVNDDPGRRTHRYYAVDVHDFAWAASPQLIQSKETISLAEGRHVNLYLYLDPAHEHLRDRYVRAAAAALVRYGEWFGPYPYPKLSVVVPPPGGNGAGGMEYPALVTAWAADVADPGLELEQVVVHEIGHQYFYGMLANNEFEEAWLDEAFTSYAEERVMREAYGRYAPTPVEAGYMTAPAALDWFAWDYDNHGHYAENVYVRGKLVLKEISKRIGDENMDRVLREYYWQWRFRHPGTADFQDVLERVTGESWESFFRTFVHDGGMTDYAITSIQSTEVKRDGKSLYEHELMIKRLGAEYPQVPLQIRFQDGTSIVRQLDGSRSATKLTVTHPSALKTATIDPYYGMLLENRRWNNTMRGVVEESEQSRWSMAAAHIVEAALKWLVW